MLRAKEAAGRTDRPPTTATCVATAAALPPTSSFQPWKPTRDMALRCMHALLSAKFLESALASRKAAAVGFVEQAVRGVVEHRPPRAAFRARGEQAWQDYLRTGQSMSADDVFGGIQSRIDVRRQELPTKRGAE